MSELVELGALWKKSSKDGKTYFEGRLGNAVLVGFINEQANEENNQPAIRLSVRNFVKK